MASPLPGLAVVLARTRAAVAPAFVVAYVLTDQLVDDSVRTETNTWIATAANVGGAAAGLLVEDISARASFTVGGLLLIAVLSLLAASLRRTTRGSSAVPTPELE